MRKPIRKRGDEELVNGVSDRFAAAFVVTLFCAIPCFVFWIMFNERSPADGLSASVATLAWILAGIALLAFLFPRVALDLMGKMWEFLHFLGTSWWWW